MADFRETTHLVDHAIKNHKDVWVRYRDVQSAIVEEVISPFEWIDEEKTLFTAYCHMRNQDGLFNIFTIVEASVQESPIENAPTRPETTEPVNTAPLLARAISRTTTEEESDLLPQKPLAKVESPQDWHRLLQYYLDCLRCEQQARSTIRKQDVYSIALEHQQALDFLQGRVDLQITLTFRHWQQSFQNFVDPSRHFGETLCLGSLFYCLDENNIVPLLYNTISIENSVENQVLVKPGEYSINITPWLESGAKPEEIAHLLAETDQYLNSGYQIHQLVEFFQSKLSGFLAGSVPIFSSAMSGLADVPRQAIFEGNGLFWLGQVEYSTAIQEIDELSNERHWNSAPDALLAILNQKQPEGLPQTGPSEEELFTISSLSKDQQQAAVSTKRPVTLISGPPGTGKTELLVNILFQAFLQGKTVLFTCQSKPVVDRLYHQLAVQLQFPGILRAGKFDQRLEMTHRIDHQISQIHKENIREFQKQYQAARIAMQKAEETLDQVQDQRAKEDSYRAELGKIEELLPKVVVTKLRRLGIPYHESEKQLFLEALAKLGDQVRGLINDRLELQARMRTAVAGTGSPHLATTTVKEYEERWGPLGGDELSFQRITRLEDLISLLQLWLNLLTTLEAKHKQDLAQAKLHDIEQKVNRALKRMNAEQGQRAHQCAEQHTRRSLLAAHKNLAEIKTEFEKRSSTPSGWKNRITNTIKILDPFSGTIQRFSAILTQFGWFDLPGAVQHSQPAEMLTLCNNVHAIILSAILLQKSKESRELYEDARETFTALSGQLSARMQSDILKMDLTGFESFSLIQELLSIQQQANDVFVHRKDIASKITDLITNNGLHLQMMAQLQEGFQGPERAFFKISDETSENQMQQYLQIWRRIVWFWELNTILENLALQKISRLSEQQSLSEVMQSRSSFLIAAQELLYAAWLDRANSLSQVSLQGASRYSLAVQEEEQLDETTLESRGKGLKALQRDNFPHILRLFPAWVAWEADIPENFPLTSELFDILIIDQAGLSAIPPALSLMYRAKHYILAVDPAQNQATVQISQVTNHQLSQKHMVEPARFSYHHSLVDFVGNSVPNAVVSLPEHFRSDPRISAFINQEFYDQPQRIQTNLARLGYQAKVTNQIGGIYWVNVKGLFQRQPDGSAENLTELEHIQELINNLIERSNQAGKPVPSTAVISPFRYQANRLRDWIKGISATRAEIQAGSPLDFLGDEKDVIILSPVVSSGTPKETLEGLEMSASWLNLAVSRARLAVIVIGDWNFCYNQMPVENAYHHLARYTREKCNSVFSSLSQLPLLGGTGSCQSGFYIDPSDPSHSRTTLEQLLLSCRDIILWIDPQFDPQVIELFDEILNREKNCKLKNIRLITTEKQVNPPAGKPVLPPGVLHNFAVYLRNFDIQFELRTTSVPAVVERSILADSTSVVLLPPFTTIYRRHRPTTEFTITRAAAEELNRLWENAARLDAIR